MLLKILYDLWPFLKEVFAGESDLSKAIRRNKLSTILFIVNVSMFGLLVYMTDQMITRQKNIKTNVVEVAIVQKQLDECLSKKPAVCPTYSVPVVPSKPIKPEPKPNPTNLESKLDAIRREDNNE